MNQSIEDDQKVQADDRTKSIEQQTVCLLWVINNKNSSKEKSPEKPQEATPDSDAVQNSSANPNMNHIDLTKTTPEVPNPNVHLIHY